MAVKQKIPLVSRLYAVPDRTYSRNQMRAGGDVAAAAWADMDETFRTITSMTPGTITAVLRLVLRKLEDVRSPKDRLEAYILIYTANRRARKTVCRLLESGPLSRFHRLDPIADPQFPVESMGAACYVTRRVQHVVPATQPEFNPNIPESYLVVEPFTARKDNDYLALDRLAAALDEGAMIDIAITPHDATPERAAHGQYGLLLESIAHARYTRDDLALDSIVNTGSGASVGFETYRRDYDDDPVAESLLRTHRKLQETLLEPHVAFSIRVLAESVEGASLIASVLAGAAFLGGAYSLISFSGSDLFLARARQDAEDASVSILPPAKGATAYAALRRLSSIATVDELVAAFRFPLAGHASLRCARKDTDPQRCKSKRSVRLGRESAPGSQRGDLSERAYLGVASLFQHLFTSGMTGSGKTTGNVNLVLNLTRLGVPVLVIEASKRDYRFLATLDKHPDPRISAFARGFEVYPVGEEGISPLCINGFQSLPGISVDERISRALASLLGALALGAPLRELLFEGLEDLFYSAPDAADPPTMADLCSCLQRLLNKKSYSGELAGNLRAALETRLNTLTKGMMGRIFQCKHGIPDVRHFFRTSCLLELEILPAEEKSLFFNFLLDRICEYVKNVPPSRSGPRLVILCEEAQQLIGVSANARSSETAPDSRAFAAQHLMHSLLEFRSLGVGFVLSTQHPSFLPPEILKAVCTRIAYQQDDAEERALLAGAMGMGRWEVDELPLLGPGEFFLMNNELVKPLRVQGPNIMEILVP